MKKRVDFDTIASMLDADCSDKNVALAIDWMKSQKRVNQCSGWLVEEIFNHPRFQSELTTFTEWASKTNWTFVIHCLYNVECPEYLEWVIDLVSEHLEHPQSGELWVRLLNTCRHKRLKQGATVWLERNNANNKHTKNIVCALLKLDPSKEIISKAKRIAKREQFPILLPVLIEYIGDEDSIKMGRRSLASKRSSFDKEQILEAMLKNDYSKYLLDLRQFAEANGGDEYFQKAFMILGHKIPQTGRFFCEFVSERYDSQIAKDLLQSSVLFSCFSNDISIAWEWFCDSKQKAIEVAIFAKILNEVGSVLPIQANEYITQWLSKTQKHPEIDQILRVQKKIQKIYEATLKRIRTGGSEDRVGSVWYLARCFKTEESLRLAQEYFDKEPNVRGSMQLAFEILVQTRSSKSVIQAKNFLQDGIDDHKKRLLLLELIKIGDDEVLSWCMNLLKNKFVYRSYDTLYTDIGKLLLLILKTQPLSNTILLRTREWLSIKPQKEEMPLYIDIVDTVVVASIGNITFHPENLLEKHKEINEVFAAHGDFAVSILGSLATKTTGRKPDIEILINLDEAKEEDLLVCCTKDSQVIQAIHPHERHGFCVDVFVQLKLLLGCNVNVVDERGLQSTYPKTYSKLQRP